MIIAFPHFLPIPLSTLEGELCVVCVCVFGVKLEMTIANPHSLQPL